MRQRAKRSQFSLKIQCLPTQSTRTAAAPGFGYESGTRRRVRPPGTNLINGSARGSPTDGELQNKANFDGGEGRITT